MAEQRLAGLDEGEARPRRRLPVGVVVAAGAALAAAAVAALAVTGMLGFWSDSTSTGHMSKHFKTLRLDSRFTLVAEKSFGSSDCLGGCRRVARYYAGSAGVQESCEAVRDALSAWADRVGPSQSAPGSCAFDGEKAGLVVTAVVSADRTVEAAWNEVRDQPITVPHSSVLVVELSEKG